MYTKLIVTGIGMVCLSVAIVFFVNSRTDESSTDRRLSVSATFYPVAFLAEQIGGNLVTVKTIVPPGIEPHDFDPSLRDITDIYQSKLFLMNGMGIDRWAEGMRTELGEKGIHALVLSESVPLSETLIHDESGMGDPHFWLDPVAYEQGAATVLAALVKIDPSNARIYRSNFNRLQKNLQGIDTKFRMLTANQCRLQIVVVPHNAFSYMTKRYGFEVYALSGVNPEQEVSAGNLSLAVQFMREKNIHAVLTEPLGNEDIAQTIAMEVPASVLTLNPIEGLLSDDLASGKNYFTVMEENWITLRKALECK